MHRHPKVLISESMIYDEIKYIFSMLGNEWVQCLNQWHSTWSYYLTWQSIKALFESGSCGGLNTCYDKYTFMEHK